MDPLTLMLIASAAMQVAGSFQQAQAAKAAGRYNAEVAYRNAAIARASAASDQGDMGRQQARVLGAIRAGYGASGVTMEGSPMDVFQSSAAESELDILRRGYQGELEAMGFNAQAKAELMSAKSQAQGAYLQGASNLLMAGAQGQQAGLFSSKTGTPLSLSSSSASTSSSSGSYQILPPSYSSGLTRVR